MPTNDALHTSAPLLVRTAEDLIGITPYLVGFYPHDSLVCVVLREGRVQATARVDLRAVDQAGIRRSVRALWASCTPDAYWLVGFGARSRAQAVVRSAARDLRKLGRRHPEAVMLGCYVVDDGRYWCLDCPACPHCPAAGGAPLDAASEIAARAVVGGLGLLADRAELAKLAQGPTAAEAEPLAALVAAQSAAVAALSPAERVAEARALSLSPDPSTIELVRLSVLVEDGDVGQQLVLAAVTIRAHDQVARWRRVLQVSVGHYQLGALEMLGFHAWLAGNGALLVVCLERLNALLDDDPRRRGRPGQKLLVTLQEQAVSPRVWEPSMTGG